MTKPRRPLRPAFVVVVGSLLAGCSAESDLWGDGALLPRSTPDPPPNGHVSSNPPPPLPQPLPVADFGPTVTQAVAPPALGSASLLVSADGRTVVATDPDRDRVILTDPSSGEARVVDLGSGAQPGRLAEDSARRVHVVLERQGKVATIDPVSGAVLGRRDVCPQPHGIAALSTGDALVVACGGGELVTLPAAPGDSIRGRVRIDVDLHDVVRRDDVLLVSRLRKAEVLLVRERDGAVLGRSTRPAVRIGSDLRDPFVGWRLVPTPTGAALVHQLATTGIVAVEQPKAYVGIAPCSGPIATAITPFVADTSTSSPQIAPENGPLVDGAVLPVDVARSPNGLQWAVIAAGNHHIPVPQVHLVSTETGPTGASATPVCRTASQVSDPPGQAVAVAFSADNEQLFVLSREPSALHVLPRQGGQFVRPSAWRTIAFGGPSREDTGHAIFHSNSGGRIACASCHPGGADDGRVWKFDTGARRTQTLQGTIEGTAPYHWGGDVAGLEAFATEVFAKRMGGKPLAADQIGTLRGYLARIPPSPAPAATDPGAARGRAIFERPTVGCAGCHSGPQLTNNDTVAVGTGGAFQVPSLLGLGRRAPYLHDGRAATLRATRGPAGGGDEHGRTSILDAGELDDLVRYLETL